MDALHSQTNISEDVSVRLGEGLVALRMAKFKNEGSTGTEAEALGEGAPKAPCEYCSTSPTAEHVNMPIP